MAETYISAEDELKAVRQQLQQLKQQTRAALQAVGIGLWTLYPDQNRIVWDEQCQEIYNWPSDTISFANFISQVHPADLPCLKETMLDPPSQRTGQPTTLEYRITSPVDQQLRWIRITGRATLQPGSIAFFSGTAQNVTEEKRKESALKAIEQRFQVAFDHASVGVAILDTQSRLQVVNKAFADMIGYSPEELTNQHFSLITHPADTTENTALIQKLLRGEADSYVFSKRYIRKDGAFIWAQISSALVRAEDGTPDSFISIIQDITAEVEAQIEQRKLLSLVGTSVDYMSVVSIEGKLQYVNPAGRQLLGLSPDEDVSRFWVHDFYTTDHLNHIRETVEPALFHKGHWSGVTHVRHLQTGEIIPTHLNAVLMRDPQTGEPLARGITLRDLRPERLAQHNLHESENRWREAIELAELGTFELDVEQQAIQLSDRLKDWLGLLPEVQPSVDQVLALTQDSVALSTALQQTLAQGIHATIDVEFRIKSQTSDENRLFHAQGRVIRNQNSRLMLRGVMQDITAQRKYAQELEAQVQSGTQALQQATSQISKQAEQLRFVTDSALTAIGLYSIVRNPDTDEVIDLRYELINQMAQRMTGRPAADLIGHTMLEVFPGIASGGMWKRYKELAQTGIPLRYHNHYTTDGYDLWYEVQGIRHGEQIVLSFLDITQLKQTQLQLEALNKDLLRSNENLQQFAYVASHDLQEPLRKIQSFGSLLREQYSDSLGQGSDLVARMQLASERMSVLIKDLLMFSRINKANGETLVAIPLSQILNQVMDNLEIAILEAKATLHIDPLPTVLGDELQLQQLFQNLLSNALKFRQQDTPLHIRINATVIAFADLPSSVMPVRQSHDYHQISISDNGIGFDEKFLDRIFQVFQRLHGRSQYEGTGIGLAIVQKVVSNHGGAIAATSQPGQGSTFRVYLPTH